MDFIEQVLFESPFLIYMVAGLAELLTVAIWHHTRDPRARVMMFVWPLVAILAGLTAAAVETDREQVQAAWSDIEMAVADDDVDAMMDRVSAGFLSDGLNKARFRQLVEAARQLMGKNAVGFRGFTVARIDDGRAETVVTAVYRPTFHTSRWQLVFIQDGDGLWRMQAAQCQDPKDLGLAEALKLVSAAKSFM